MAECELEIRFDRADRTYRGGEPISGEVVVRTRGVVPCRRLVVERFWETRGKGTRNRGRKTAIELFGGEWRTPGPHRYPFTFKAPSYPPTYHGRALHVEHLVAARADIPWAPNALKEEKFEVSGEGDGDGAMEAAMAPAGHPIGQPATFGPLAQGCGLMAGIGLIVIGIPLCAIGVGILLIPLGVYIVYRMLRNTIAETRLGRVSIDLGRGGRVCPGEAMPVKIAFTAAADLTLTGITAILTCKELCSSGSGKNRTTHTQVLHDQTIVLAPAQTINAKRAVAVSGSIPFPPDAAYSFASADNRVVWDVEFRIAQRGWGEWRQKRLVGVMPRQLLEGATAAAGHRAMTVAAAIDEPQPPRFELPAQSHVTPTADAPATRIDQEPAEAAAVDPPVVTDAPIVEPSPGPAVAPATDHPSTEDPGDLLRCIEAIKTADRFGDERKRLIEAMRGRRFMLSIVVQRVSWTMGVGFDTPFAKGRTVIGTIDGSDAPVAIRFVPSQNSRIDALKPGEHVAAAAVVVDFNRLHDRLEMEAIDHG